jgi:hypothetical protein
MTRRRAVDLALLPIALVVVVLEDVVWAGLRALLGTVAHLGPLRRLEAQIAALPGWAALPLFLIPEGVGKLGEFWALALLVHGQAWAAGAVYVGVRLVATLMAVFVYRACERTLLGYRWFAALMGVVEHVRHWAGRVTGELRLILRGMAGRARTRAALRLLALRRAYGLRTFRSGRG